MRGAGDEVGENGRKAHASRHRGATGRLLGRRQSRDLAMYPDMRWPNPKYKRNETHFRTGSPCGSRSGVFSDDRAHLVRKLILNTTVGVIMF